MKIFRKNKSGNEKAVEMKVLRRTDEIREKQP
jgi:hypothetical protein